MRPGQERRNQQNKTVDRNLLGQHPSRLPGILPRQRQKYRASAKWVYDREQRADNQNRSLDRLEQVSSCLFTAPSLSCPTKKSFFDF
jgi:hypothetical protein